MLGYASLPSACARDKSPDGVPDSTMAAHDGATPRAGTARTRGVAKQ
jgi:hypothetical protein